MSNTLDRYDNPEVVEAPPPEDPFYEEPGGGIPWRRYISALMRRKWLIVGIVALGAVAGMVAARMVEPQYVARATIWITNTERDRDAQGPIRSEELLRSYAWLDLLRSYTVLEPVVMDQRLYLRPGIQDEELFSGFRLAEEFIPGEYTLVTLPGETYRLRHAVRGVVETGSVGDSIGTSAGFEWAPPATALAEGQEIPFTVVTPREAAWQLARRISAVLPQRDGNFLVVTLEGSNPERLARVINSVNQHFVEVASELKRAKLDELTEILGEQLDRAEQNMMEAEIALEQFRVNTITLPSEPSRAVAPGIEATRDPAMGRYFDMRIERETLRQQREMLENALREPVDPGELVQRLEGVDAVEGSSELQAALATLVDQRSERRALLRQYTEEHPAVQETDAAIRRLEQQEIPRLARNLLTQLREEEAMIDRTLASAAGELRQIPPRAIEEARLRRDWEIKENLFTVLQQRYEEARLAAISSIPDVRVLDRAVPPRQPENGDVPMRNLLMAIIGSLGLAIGGVLVWDMIDPKVQYPEQVSGELDLSILGVIPARKTQGRFFRKGNEAEMREAFRSIRLNLLHAYGAAGPVVFAISSPGSGDGKSFVAQNLARGFANLSRRTLLVDGDVRRGRLHRVFEIGRRPGLLDTVRGRVPLEDVIRPTPIENLDFIPNGTSSPDAPEVLASAELRHILGDLKSEYEVILFDTAPLGAGVDPFIFATLTSNIVLVLRTGETDRFAASNQLEMLRRLPVRILGGVLNGVEHTGTYRYYSYLPEYALPEPEDESDMAREILTATTSRGA